MLNCGSCVVHNWSFVVSRLSRVMSHGVMQDWCFQVGSFVMSGSSAMVYNGSFMVYSCSLMMKGSIVMRRRQVMGRSIVMNRGIVVFRNCLVHW